MNKAFTRYAITSLLLMVFSLNTLLGFACGAGWDLGYNAGHHQHEKSAGHHTSKPDSAHHPENDDHEKPNGNKEKNEDCCAGNVLTISLADKTAPKSADEIDPVCFSVFTIISPYLFNTPGLYNARNSSSYLIPGHPPPIADIRIAIQSFQI